MLILDRARRKGFHPDELEDVQQDVIQAAMNFRFKPEKSNGARTRATPATQNHNATNPHSVGYALG